MERTQIKFSAPESCGNLFIPRHNTIDVETRIKILPKFIVEKIAAGEVVERPASVVKELVENSIDAKASRIFVFVKKGGLDEIRVVDNGTGMSKEEAILAFERHATSKIKDLEDLNRIKTLGFRGEALPSIAAVSKVVMNTRRKDDIVGTKVIIEGGEIKNVEEIGCPRGTSIFVRDIFYNTPARKKFLKSERIELGYIIGTVEKYAMIYENTHFKLMHNGRVIFDLPPGNLRERIAKLWGKDVAKDMIEIKSEKKIKISGLISKPYLTRKDKNRIVVFVNGRFVKSSFLTNCIINGYGTLLFRDSYPYAVIKIEIDPGDVDVNVHPAKLFVKFHDESLIMNEIKDSIWNTLTALENIPSKEGGKKVFEPMISPEIKREKQITFEVKKKKSGRIEEFIPKMRTLPYEILGQVDDTYIIMKAKDSLIIVDQHAAHERIRYERFLRQMMERKIQELLDPVTINLSPKDYEDILSIKESLKEYGILIEDFGAGTIIVRAIPPILSRNDIKDIIKDIIDIGAKYVNKKKDEMIKLISCKGAIKAHEKLSIFEMEELIAQLLKCENPYTCPHGRPTTIKITVKELEKMFKRKE